MTAAHGLSATARPRGRAVARRRLRWRWFVLGAVAMFLAWAGWLAVGALSARDSAASFEATVASATSHARALDMSALSGDLGQLRIQAAEVDAVMSGPQWTPATWLPWVGRDVVAARTTAAALDDVMRVGEGLEPLLPSLAPSRLRGPGGHIDVASLKAAVLALQRLSVALSSARMELDAMNPDGLIGPLGAAVRRAQSSLASAPETVAAFATLPALLGGDGPRTYAVLLLNPAELRGGGGFFGGYAIVKADHGDISLEKVGPSDDLVKAGPLDVSSLPQEYRALWGESALEWQSVNISPNFPYAGQLTQQGFAKLGIHVDGVITLDSKVAAALLAGTGPVSANGVTITSKNADPYFTKGIYEQFPDGAGHKQQALALFAQLFERLTTGQLDLKAMASALAPLLDQRRLLFWTSYPKVEAPFAALPVGGVVPDATGPWTTIALINGAGNKMDAYVRSRASFLSNRCTSSTAPSTVTLQLANLAPANLPPYVDQRLDDPTAPKGSTLSLAYVYGPVGSALVSADLDGKPVPVQTGVERGHPVWRFSVPLLRGQSRTLTVKVAEPHDGSSSTPVVLAQPMEIDESTAATAVPCG